MLIAFELLPRKKAPWPASYGTIQPFKDTEEWFATRCGAAVELLGDERPVIEGVPITMGRVFHAAADRYVLLLEVKGPSPRDIIFLERTTDGRKTV
jgi:hypothetical protein